MTTEDYNTKIEWRDIPGYEGLYQVSNTGLIRRGKIGSNSVSAFSPLKPYTGNYGYIRYTISKEGIEKTICVHRLVMLAFTGVCPTGMEVNHINGIKTDNHVKNLEYVTRKENIIHSARILKTHHSFGCGEFNRNTKLTESDVREIRSLFDNGTSIRDIAHQFSVSSPTIQAVIDHKTWKHVK